MRILVAGSNGMIGSAAVRYLTGQGHAVVRLVRRAPGEGEVWWDPNREDIDTAGLEGFDGVVQLASLPWPMRWTDQFKEQMRQNRLGTTGLLARSLAGCSRKPGILVCASGMGFYAPAGDQVISEAAPAGTGFLASLQQDGEAATAPAGAAGIRVVHLRIPPVLGGPSLQRGGVWAGSGQQWMSWVGRDELVAIIEFALQTESLTGPVNPVSPNPLRNADYAVATQRALGRRPCMRLPAGLVRLFFGEMGQEFLLASRRLHPQRLLEAGYRFRFPDIKAALHHELNIAAPEG